MQNTERFGVSAIQEICPSQFDKKDWVKGPLGQRRTKLLHCSVSISSSGQDQSIAIMGQCLVRCLGDLGFVKFQGIILRSEHGDQSGMGPVKGVWRIMRKLSNNRRVGFDP